MTDQPFLGLSNRADRMRATVYDLFAKAGWKGDRNHPDRPGIDPPVLECMILLDGGYSASGALTVTSRGTLRFASPMRSKETGEVMVNDVYFDWEVLQMVVVPNADVAKPTSIIVG